MISSVAPRAQARVSLVVPWSAARSWRLGALIACGAWLGTGCQDGYPIAPTVCDEWCDQTRRLDCGSYDPAACVVACEAAGLSLDACSAFTEQTVQCLRDHPSGQVDCSDPFGAHLLPELAQCETDQAVALACGSAQHAGGSQPPD